MARRDALAKNPRVAALLGELRGRIGDVEMRRMNAEVDFGDHSAAEVARTWLDAMGADANEAPMIRILPPDDYGPLDDACARAGEFDWIVFSSANAVEAVTAGTGAPAAGGSSAALALHPRLRALDAQAEQYRYSANASRRMLWPELELRASYGFRADEIPGGSFHGLPVGPQPQDDMYSATVALMLPVFMVQRELAEGAEMDARARAVMAERRAAELELRGEIAAARITERAAARTVALLADTVVATQRRALDVALAAYAAGNTDLWRALDSAHALYDETLALTRARQELARAQASLLAIGARGDGIGVRVPEPVRSAAR